MPVCPGGPEPPGPLPTVGSLPTASAALPIPRDPSTTAMATIRIRIRVRRIRSRARRDIVRLLASEWTLTTLRDGVEAKFTPLPTGPTDYAGRSTVAAENDAARRAPPRQGGVPRVSAWRVWRRLRPLPGGRVGCVTGVTGVAHSE